MSRSRVRTRDGRLRLRVDLPQDVVAQADRIASETGIEREVVLGDLAASALPDLLAELADDLVARAAKQRLNKARLPALNSR